MNKLINLIPNSSFEEFEYNDDSGVTNVKLKDWSAVNENQINDLNSYNGLYSINLKSENNTIFVNFGNYNPQHIYYLRIYCKTIGVQKFTLNINRDLSQSIISKSINIDSSNWKPISYRIDTMDFMSNSYSNCSINLTKTNNSSEDISIDSIMLIDLTNAFGEGYEPSNEWCDKNIPYFEKEYDLKLIPKEIEFIHKNQFIYHDDTKKYYTDNYSPKLMFVIKNIDKNYNSNNLQDIINNVTLTYTIFTDSDIKTCTEYLSLDKLTSEYVNNECYVTYDNFNFEKNNCYVKFEINSTLRDETNVKDEMTLYFINKQIILDYNLDFDLSYASTYLRKLKGTTNAYTDVPINIDVYINGVKTSPVDILNKDDKLTVFEKDLYLNDGYNVIKVVATDVCGNTKELLSHINVDCMTPAPEKENLLENFIADDDLKISLDIGNADLKYKTKHSGLEKDIIIDTSVDSHYFKLIGENANLYRISKENIPKIKGDIIKRPLVISFDYVEKIYDGTNDITNEVRKLKLNNGYYLRDVHKEYNDYANTGLVKSTNERKITSETLFVANEDIPVKCTLDKPNIDFSNVYINIDGVEGYSLYNEVDDNAEFIFNLPTIREVSHEYIDVIINGFENDEENNNDIHTWIKSQIVINNNDNNEINDIECNDAVLKGLFYCAYTDNEQTKFLAVNSLNCFDNNNHKINLPIFKEFENLEDCKNWLSLVHNVISKVELVRDESYSQNAVLKFTFIDDVTSYKVIDKVNIKYNYSNKTDLEYLTYKSSDDEMIQVDFSKAFFKTKNVIDTYQPITINDIEFIKGNLGDASNNYQIANYSIHGKILKRTIYPHIKCLDKIYDGSPVVPFELTGDYYSHRWSDKFYNGFENIIENDDVFIDNTYEGNKDDEFHLYTKSCESTLLFEDANVGNNKQVSINSLILQGHDVENYELGEITSNFSASIFVRPIEIVINKIRLLRATRKWEIDYVILNDIKEDKLSIVYNSNDDLNIQVYGGIDNNGESIHNSSNVDVLSLFFNYKFDYNYKFENIDTEIKQIDKNSNIAYWVNDARKAEPDTERIDIDIATDTNYPGGIKLSASTLDNIGQISYFESSDKQYKIYTGCKVLIKNINLNPINDKIKNYKLLNNTYETEIEII